MNKEIRKILLLRILKNNIENNIIENLDNETKYIKNEIIKNKNIKLHKEKVKDELITSIEYVTKVENLSELLLVYINKEYLNEKSKEIINNWCKIIKLDNYKIIDNRENLEKEIKENKPRAILSCEEVEIFNFKDIRIEIIRGFELRYKGIPIVFTYLPTMQIMKPDLKKEIWQDLKIIKGIIKYG